LRQKGGAAVPDARTPACTGKRVLKQSREGTG
jgi:hypothetical protein